MSVLRLSYPPEASAMWRLVDGAIRKAAAYREWIEAAHAAIQASDHPMVRGPYRLSIVVHRPCEAGACERDLDTLLGPLTAALTACGVVGGEALADRIVVRWSREARPGGELEIEASRA